MFRFVLTFMFRPGSFSISCLARSLQDFLAAGGTLESSSQYLEGEWPYKAAGVAWVIRVFVTNPVDFPVTEIEIAVAYKFNRLFNNWFVLMNKIVGLFVCLFVCMQYMANVNCQGEAAKFVFYVVWTVVWLYCLVLNR